MLSPMRNRFRRVVLQTANSSKVVVGAVRCNHSKRQLKRLFQNHPASKRNQIRAGTQPKYELPEPPVHPPIFIPKVVLPNGWSQPPSTDSDSNVLRQRDALPFGIERTKNKPNGAIGFLPVYSNVRLGGTKHTTLIRKITGDKDLFLQELKSVLEIAPNDEKSTTWRATKTTLEVNGNQTKKIKEWLGGLGF